MELLTGLDMVEIPRIKNSIENPRFLERFFSEEERNLFEGRGESAAQTVAANFAAKEAFAKALGTGVRGFELRDVAVLRDELGAPYFVLRGGAAKAGAGFHFSVSLTHTKELAAAVVVAFRET